MNKYEDYTMEGEESGLVKALKATGAMAAVSLPAIAFAYNNQITDWIDQKRVDWGIDEPIYATVMECDYNGEPLGEVGVPSYFTDLTYSLNEVETFEELMKKERVFIPVESDSTVGTPSRNLKKVADERGEGLHDLLDDDSNQFLSLDNLSPAYCTALPGTNIAQHLDLQAQRLAEVESQRQYDVAEASYEPSVRPASGLEE